MEGAKGSSKSFEDVRTGGEGVAWGRVGSKGVTRGSQEWSREGHPHKHKESRRQEVDKNRTIRAPKRTQQPRDQSNGSQHIPPYIPDLSIAGPPYTDHQKLRGYNSGFRHHNRRKILTDHGPRRSPTHPRSRRLSTKSLRNLTALHPTSPYPTRNKRERIARHPGRHSGGRRDGGKKAHGRGEPAARINRRETLTSARPRHLQWYSASHVSHSSIFFTLDSGCTRGDTKAPVGRRGTGDGGRNGRTVLQPR